MLVAEIPIRLVSLANQREHWSRRAARAQRHKGLVEAIVGPIWRQGQLELPLTVLITRIAPRRLDSDNLAISAKSIRDGVADMIGIDDADPRVIWLYDQERGGVKEYAVRIEISERRADQ